MEKLVFIIDDDPVYLNFMKSHFKQMSGYRVEVFSSGEEGLKQLTQKTPDMLIMDHDLSDPEKDGLYYLKKIKKQKPSIPAVYITSNSTPSVKQEALKAGASAFITKGDAFLVQLRTAIDDINTSKKKGIFGRLFR